MANNTQLNQNSTAGDIIGTEEIGGVKYELVKVAFGADGVITKVSTASPLPTENIGGIDVNNFPANQTNSLTDAELRATPVPISATNLDIRDLAFATDKVDASGTVLGTGTNVIGRVGIDQTTPGTTNAVKATNFPTTVDTNAGNVSANTPRVVIATDQATLPTSEVAPTAILNGKTTVTTAGTRVALAVSTACKSVTIKAALSNTGIIYVGNSTVSASNGFELGAGDTVSMDISNLSTVNIDSSANGQSVTYIGVN